MLLPASIMCIANSVVVLSLGVTEKRGLPVRAMLLIMQIKMSLPVSRPLA